MTAKPALSQGRRQGGVLFHYRDVLKIGFIQLPLGKKYGIMAVVSQFSGPVIGQQHHVQKMGAGGFVVTQAKAFPFPQQPSCDIQAFQRLGLALG